ncbi:MAG: hypothetical protein O2887_14595 [Bacteroidetes bacterium]|nr:hypothetical protein [Bacteroidota bacterium]MDA1121698.1 hypothetical protein [Bacteroidota bacterium]
MKEITEEQIFDLIDGKLSDEEKSVILTELPHYPEAKKLYRSLLMTEGYITAHAIEKPSSDFDDRLMAEVKSIMLRKKRNSVLYRALTIFGLITTSSLVGSIFLATESGATAQPSLYLQRILSISGQLSGSWSLVSGETFQMLVLLIVAFTFFVIADRLLLKHFHLRHH